MAKHTKTTTPRKRSPKTAARRSAAAMPELAFKLPPAGHDTVLSDGALSALWSAQPSLDEIDASWD